MNSIKVSCSKFTLKLTSLSLIFLKDISKEIFDMAAAIQTLIIQLRFVVKGPWFWADVDVSVSTRSYVIRYTI